MHYRSSNYPVRHLVKSCLTQTNDENQWTVNWRFHICMITILSASETIISSNISGVQGIDSLCKEWIFLLTLIMSVMLPVKRIQSQMHRDLLLMPWSFRTHNVSKCFWLYGWKVSTNRPSINSACQYFSTMRQSCTYPVYWRTGNIKKDVKKLTLSLLVWLMNPSSCVVTNRCSMDAWCSVVQCDVSLARLLCDTVLIFFFFLQSNQQIAARAAMHCMYPCCWR